MTSTRPSRMKQDGTQVESQPSPETTAGFSRPVDCCPLSSTGAGVTIATPNALPAFGRRIKALEQWVGAELVTRTQPVTLTGAGKLFLDAARNAAEVLHTARPQLQESPGELEGLAYCHCNAP